MTRLRAILVAVALVHCRSAATPIGRAPPGSDDTEPDPDPLLGGGSTMRQEPDATQPQPPKVELPVVACGPDAAPSDAGECALPESQCVDVSWLLYFIDGTCTNGTCAWTSKMVQCPNYCSMGACVAPQLTAPSK